MRGYDCGVERDADGECGGCVARERVARRGRSLVVDENLSKRRIDHGGLLSVALELYYTRQCT